MKILKIHNDWTSSEIRKELNSYGGCGYYRTIKVAQAIEKDHQVDVWGREWHDLYQEVKAKYKDPTTVNEKFFESIFKNYDIVWFHHMENVQTFAWMRVAADKYGTKLVCDIDDNYLDIDDSNPAKKKLDRGQYKATKKGYVAQKSTQRIADLSTILSFCDAITVSTLPLKERIQNHIKEVHNIDKPVFVLPNYNDLADWNYEKAKGNSVIIGYIGGLSHAGDFEMVLPAIKKILEKYKDVSFQVIGQMDLKTAKKTFGKWEQSLRNRIVLINATATQPEYPLHLSLQPFSIGIAPLTDTLFNKSKSHIKWMEYSMYKIPVVASKVYPYYKDILGKPTIKHEETGLLCETEEDWVNNLSRLIENEKLRNKLGENAYNFIKENWQYRDNKNQILEVVNKITQLS